MAGPFAGLNVASYALRAFQTALQTTGHNIANVNTPGYTRQRVEFSANPPRNFYEQGWKSVGQGVRMTQIVRIRDAFLDASASQTSSNLGRFETVASALGNIERVYGEPTDRGIAAALGAFFDSWSGLASAPNDPASRIQVQQAGQTLTDRVRGAWQDLDALSQSMDARIMGAVDRIDGLAHQISALNAAIRDARATGGEPNDLMDQRTQALNDLSKIVNVSTATFDDGSLAVYASGFTLVDSGGSRPFPRTYDAAAGTVTDGAVTYPVRSGELSGLFTGLGQVQSQKAALDQLANSMRATFNPLHQTGVGANGNTGLDFFSPLLPGLPTGAREFDLAMEVKADPTAIAASTTGKPGDGGLALAFSQLRDDAIVSLGGRSFADYFGQQVSTVAGQVSYFESALATEEAVQQQIQNQIQAVSGVSIDDEMADMMRFQRSYQAAAKALTIFDQVAEDLIGMLRR